MPSKARDLTPWITRQRPERERVDPFRPHGFCLEEECSDTGSIDNSGVILLTNKECPWRCLMCDLWRHTTNQTVPAGAIPQQIEYALGQFDSRPKQLKLYNSGSFFDPAAIPPADYPAIAQTVAFAKRVVVESHPRLVGDKALRFRDLLRGSLEVAMGLETVHPQMLPRLNKKFELAHFSQAAEFLRDNGIAMRAFVLVKPPFMSETEGVEWAVKSAAFALLRRCRGLTHPDSSRQWRDGTPDGKRPILAATAFVLGKSAGTRPASARQRKNFRRHLGFETILSVPGLF